MIKLAQAQIRVFSAIALAAVFLIAQPLCASEGELKSQAQGKSAIAGNPESPKAYIQYAEWLVAKGELEKASEILEEGRTKAHPSAELQVALGQVYKTLGLFSRSESVSREALTVDQDFVPAHIILGELYFEMGWPKSGLDSFRQAVTCGPQQTLPKVKLVGGLLAAGLLTEAEEECLKFLSVSAEDTDLWLSLGQVFEKQGKQRAAFTTYGQALTLDPALAEAHSRRGRLFCQFGQYDSAIDECQQALHLDPQDALAHAYLGVAYSQIGKKDQAREHADIAQAGGLNMTSVWDKIGK